jgi:tellurite resistance protein
VRTMRHPKARLTANLFGTSFGLCGLAQCWSVARSTIGSPSWVADVLWILAALTWLVTLVAYVSNAGAAGRLVSDLTDPTFGPFTSLVVIVPMQLGTALASYSRDLGNSVFLVSLVLTVGLGGWLSAQWITRDLQLSQWHPGYFLPTVGGGLIAAAGSAALGHQALAQLMFGYGLICWFVLGSIMLQRLFTQPALPTALLPTIAIEVAPPFVAANAWFVITGDRLDAVAFALAGYGILMVTVQIGMIPVYRTVPFGPGWWAFSFSYAAVVVVAVRWLAAGDVTGVRPLTSALLALVTLGITTLAVRTGMHLWRGTYLPRPAQPSAAGRTGSPDAMSDGSGHSTDAPPGGPLEAVPASRRAVHARSVPQAVRGPDDHGRDHA